MNRLKFKDIIFLNVFAAIMFFSSVAVHAGEAVRVYLELTDNTAMVWPVDQGKNYLRGRVVLLDASNELATTFSGLPISDAQLILKSNNYGSSVRFSTTPATDLDLADSDWESAAESVTIPLVVSWQEFAVSYDNIDEVGDDTIIATLKQGTTTVSGQAEVTVEAPVANCWVLRTGGISSLPGILDEVPDQKRDGGRIKRPGDPTTIDIFAVFYRETDQKYYFTNNVPEDAKKVKVGSDNATLEDGHAQIEVTKSAYNPPKAADDAEDTFKDGKEFRFEPKAYWTFTRWVGGQSEDVTETELLNVTETSKFFNEKGGDEDKDKDKRFDYAIYKAGKINKITIVGLPVNQVTSSGEHRESGFEAQDQAPGTAKISPWDAYKLLKDRTKKPSPAFRVPGKAGETYIYGAIVGYDEDNKPAPFAEGKKVTFYLKRQGGVSINSTETELEALPDYADGPPYNGSSITTKYEYQAFMPFKIPVTASTADGSIASITSLYLSDIIVDGTSLSSSLYDNINEESEGIDFVAQDTIASIDLGDINSLDGGEAGDDAEVVIEGKADERSFNLRVLTNGGSTVKVSPRRDSSDTETGGSSEVEIPNDKDNTAKEDVAFYKALDKNNLFFVFEGLDKATNVVQYYPDTSDGISMDAAGGSDVEPSNISTDYVLVKVNLDQEEKHNKVLLSGIITAKDAFGNNYSAENTTLEDSDIKGKVYLPLIEESSRLENDPLVENVNSLFSKARAITFAGSGEIEASSTATASDTEFPGASVKINDDDVEISFSLDEITENQDVAVVKFTTSGETLSRKLTVNMRVARQVSLSNMFVPVPGVTDTPVNLYLEDQNSSPIRPVAVMDTSADGIEVSLAADNGTLSSSVGEKVNLKTDSPKKVFTVNPDAGKTVMTVNAFTNSYGDTTLVLNFVPDFEPPYVGEISSGNCIVMIEVVDNQAVDLSGTEVMVLDDNGVDITGTLTRSDSEDGSSGTVILGDFPDGDGDYTLLITARDRWNNKKEVSRSVSVSCESKSSECIEVEPAFGVIGNTFDVNIRGSETDFIDGVSEVSFDCTGVTVNSTTVSSATEIKANITIADNAPENSCDITISTGFNVVTCNDMFKVFTEEPGPPECVSVSPSSGMAGAAEMDVTIEVDSSTVSGSTTVNSSDVDFECDGITVLDAVLTFDSNGQTEPSSTGNNKASVIATISISDDAQDCTGDVAVNLGNTETVCNDAFSVGAGMALCSLTGIEPQSIKAGTRFRVITLSGENINYNRTSEISFEGAEDKISVLFAFTSRSHTRLNVFVLIKSGLEPGEYPVTVTTDEEQCSGVSLTVE